MPNKEDAFYPQLLLQRLQNSKTPVLQEFPNLVNMTLICLFHLISIHIIVTWICIFRVNAVSQKQMREGNCRKDPPAPPHPNQSNSFPSLYLCKLNGDPGDNAFDIKGNCEANWKSEKASVWNTSGLETTSIGAAHRCPTDGLWPGPGRKQWCWRWGLPIAPDDKTPTLWVWETSVCLFMLLVGMRVSVWIRMSSEVTLICQLSTGCTTPYHSPIHLTHLFHQLGFWKHWGLQLLPFPSCSSFTPPSLSPSDTSD